MRKYIVFLLSILIAFSFIGCTKEKNKNQNSFVDIYKEKATEFIENGDTESAIKVLEEGITTTNDNELKKMLEELKNNNKDVSSEAKEDSSIESIVSKTFDINDYIGWWNETEDVYTTGGMWLDICDDGGAFLSFSIALVQMNGTREATTDYLMILKEDIDDNIIKSTFTDSFGNFGVVNIEFLQDKIICTISNLQEPPEGADWGIYNGDYVLKYHSVEH